jgi:p-hydroxybenzoate 3-monooxygenase
VTLLVQAITAWHRTGDERGLDAYSRTALRRVWRAELFSAWMTAILHVDPADDAFTSRLRLSQLEYLVSSRAAETTLAENYTGLPLDTTGQW